MTVRTNWVDQEFAILNGAPTFLTLADDHARPHRVKLELPDHWQQSVTSLPRVSDGDPHHYVATDFDELVDSPILCGNPNIYRFNVGDREHLLVNQGEGGVWDGAKAVKDVANIVAEQHRTWAVVPYDRYIFFNLIVERGGGLEHDNSTVMMTSRWSFRPRKDYLRWLGLVSHEFFHTWNIRRLRPRPLVNYDYENENYTHSLWIAEGITSYYDDLAIVRSGVCTQKEYLQLLSKQVESLQTTPGRLAQSLSDSSHDTWIKFYRPDENTQNSRISYYVKGAVVAFLLDARIRKATRGRKSLDDVMRLLYQRYAGDRGYTPDDFRAIASEVADENLSGWFHKRIDTSEDLDYNETLEWFGLEFKPSDEAKKTAESDEPPEKKAWLGVTTGNSDGRLTVSRVQRDSPAFAAGINPEDEIVAIGQYRVTPEKWESRLKQFKSGDSIELLVARREKLLRLDVTFANEPPKKWLLSVSPKATDEQKNRLADWLRTKQKAK